VNRPTFALLATVTITGTPALTRDALGQVYGYQPYGRPPGDTGQLVPRTGAQTTREPAKAGSHRFIIAR
jgi:hypothetical protein